jgi:hypothetical protein
MQQKDWFHFHEDLVFVKRKLECKSEKRGTNIGKLSGEALYTSYMQLLAAVLFSGGKGLYVIVFQFVGCAIFFWLVCDIFAFVCMM